MESILNITFTCSSGEGKLGYSIMGILSSFNSVGFDDPIWYKRPEDPETGWLPWTPGVELDLSTTSSWQIKTADGDSRFYALSKDEYNYFNFVLRGTEDFKVNIAGKINATRTSVTTSTTYSFYRLFANCKALVSAKGLTFGKLTEKGCYKEMFKGCVNLVESPETLPATALSEECYQGMFLNCVSLTSVPELLSTSAASWCYKGMFCNCEKIKKAPDLNLKYFVGNCWGCYEFMFQGCKSLTSIKLQYSGNFEYRYFQDWVVEVTKKGTLYYNGVDTTKGSSAIPSNWTVKPFNK